MKPDLGPAAPIRDECLERGRAVAEASSSSLEMRRETEPALKSSNENGLKKGANRGKVAARFSEGFEDKSL